MTFLCLSSLYRWTICVTMSVTGEGSDLPWPVPDPVVSNKPTICLLLKRESVISCLLFTFVCLLSPYTILQSLSKHLLSYCPYTIPKCWTGHQSCLKRRCNALADFGLAGCYAVGSEADSVVTGVDLQEQWSSMSCEKATALLCEQRSQKAFAFTSAPLEPPFSRF